VRLASVTVRNALPVRRFEVAELADVVVLAGPNGVGKTRLLEAIIARLRGDGQPEVQATVQATTDAETSAWGGKAELDLADANDTQLLLQTLQAARRRKNLSSSLVNFESDRTIQPLQPLQFTWDMQDPDEEEVAWHTTFGFMRDRFQDTVHAMFRMIETRKQLIANRYIQLQREGHDSMKLTSSDPMDEFKRVFEMLLAPKQLVDPSARVQQLQYIQDGETFAFNTLSSGEREVVNIAFDFLLRRPKDCIVFFDEPELHLHPELSYKLLRTLRSIGERNQFVLSTHSPDVISSSLDQSVIFIAPASEEADGQPKNQAIPVEESDETNQALRLLGQSIGIVALGKRIVLIEGTDSSLDKQTYGSILGNSHPDLVLVPSGGKHVIESFDTVYDAVLSHTIWGVEFFMLCDRDSSPPASEVSERAAAEGRLRRLSRYHLENYFLNEFVWAEAFADLEPADSWLRDPAQIRAALREIAATFTSYAVSLAVSSRLRQKVGNVALMPKGCNGKSMAETQELLVARATVESQRVVSALEDDVIRREVEESFGQLDSAITDDSDLWQEAIPGKRVLAAFASRAGVSTPRAKSLYLAAAAKSEHKPFAEIIAQFDAMSA
jgi:predicted ATPase